MSQNPAGDFRSMNVAIPSDRDWAANADKQKREMGGTFDSVFSPERYGEGVRRMHQKRKDLVALMTRLKPSPWTVVNLMPFPLNVNGVLHSHLAGADGNQVPACPVGREFSRMVIRDVHYSIKDEGAGMDNLDNYTPQPWDPSLLAQDYENEFNTRMGCGGVLVFPGDKDPKDADVQEDMAKARLKRNRWLLRKVQEAEVEWGDSSGRGRKNITELHRKAAEVLLHEKILKQQPAWLIAADEAGKAPEPCPGCGAVADEKAALCKHCRHVYQPLKAYEAGLIGYGHVAMERLTAEQRRKAIEIRNEREKAKREAEAGSAEEALPSSVTTRDEPQAEVIDQSKQQKTSPQINTN